MASAVTSPRPEGDSEYYGASTLEWQESQLQESHGYFKACALNQSINQSLHIFTAVQKTIQDSCRQIWHGSAW